MASRRPTAPGELAAIERFVNDMRASTPAELVRWLAANRPTGRRLRADADDLANAVALREAFRSLLAANNNVGRSRAAEAQVDEALVRCRVRPVVGAEGLEFTTAADGEDAVLGGYLCIMLRAVVDGSWSRLKACANEDCRYAFFDRSRNRAGAWCEMRTCGNLLKARRHRARRAGDATYSVRSMNGS